MINVFRMELYRVFRSMSTWILLLVYFCLYLFAGGMIGMLTGNSEIVTNFQSELASVSGTQAMQGGVSVYVDESQMDTMQSMFGEITDYAEMFNMCMMGIMRCAYVLISLLIVVLNIRSLPSVFATIFTEAFDFEAIFGGFSGSCMMYGIKRGLFSNEAGVGSAPNASASAEVSHPAKQGLVQVLSVFIDTILICSATAFMCMCSGVAPSEELSGAPYVQAALRETLGAFGPIFITVAMILFAFTTLLGNLFYVDKCLSYIMGRVPGKTFMRVYHIIASLVVLLGAGLSADLLWNISDIFMGGMTLINMPVIFFLGKYALRALKDYEKQRREGSEPVFHARDIDLPHEVDYWQ